MSERTPPRRADALIHGAVLALALVGAGVALVGAFGAEEEQESDVHAERVVSRPVEPEPAPETLGPVPALPTVPDLATEPPPARPTGDEDPRLAALGVEMRYLSRARELLADHPAEALSVLEQHRRGHPQGVLREEREAFAIEALVTLGQRDAAERRYYDFRRDFPASDFAARLATLLR